MSIINTIQGTFVENVKENTENIKYLLENTTSVEQLTNAVNSAENRINASIDSKVNSKEIKYTYYNVSVLPQDINPLSKTYTYTNAEIKLTDLVFVSPQANTGTENNGKVIAEVGFRPLQQERDGEIKFIVDNTPTLPIKVTLFVMRKGGV